MKKNRLKKKEIIERIANERFERKLLRANKDKLKQEYKKIRANNIAKYIKLSAGIEDFCNKNNVAKWGKVLPPMIRLDEHSTLFDNPDKLLKTLLQILYSAKTYENYPKVHFSGRMGFGALYLIDNMCWEIARKRKWELQHQNMDIKDQTIYSKLRSFFSTEYDDDDAYMTNEKVVINRSEKIMANQQYLVKSKEITEMVKKAISENGNTNFELSHEAYQAINSTITEHFDNIFLHAPNSEFGYLCGFYDKALHELNILIFNFGKTISETLEENGLPVKIKDEVQDVLRSHTKRNYFGLYNKVFTKENALTLLALQEGVSSRIDYDNTRGHGWIDYIEHCFELSEKCKISLISGNTAIKIDNKYQISKRYFINRERRMLALNETNNIYEKPDEEYVKNMATHFPGLIIETKINL